MPTFYSGDEDCAWLRSTHLKGFTLPSFRSFVLAGNEDCPTAMDLYRSINPDDNEAPVCSFVLTDDGEYRLAVY